MDIKRLLFDMVGYSLTLSYIFSMLFILLNVFFFGSTLLIEENILILIGEIVMGIFSLIWISLNYKLSYREVNK